MTDSDNDIKRQIANLCCYCNTNPSAKSEHVFPASLGGEALYMDCVCDKCNNDFSPLEIELIQKSPVGMMKSVAEVSGYKKKQYWSNPIKYPEIFMHDHKEHIVLEVGLHGKFRPHLRTQIIKIKEEIHTASSLKEEATEFANLLHEWVKHHRTVCTRLPSNKNDNFDVVKIDIQGNSSLRHNEIKKKIKNEIVIYALTDGQEENLLNDFEPRLFIDDRKRLLIRARNIEEGLQLIETIVKVIYNKQPITSIENYVLPSSEWIKIHFGFDVIKAQRALMKIGLNVLMYYYPELKYDPRLSNAKQYVLNETPFNGGLADRNEIFDKSDSTHQVFFMQHAEGVMVRICLFSYITYLFALPGLMIKKPGEAFGLIVDYEKKKNMYFQNLEEWAISRMQQLGWLADSEQDEIII